MILYGRKIMHHYCGQEKIMQLKAVLFDLDDTLVFTRELIPSALEQAFGIFQAHNLRGEYDVFMCANRKAYEEIFVRMKTPSFAGGSLVWRRTLEILGVPQPVRYVEQIEKAFVDAIYERTALKPGAIEVLSELRNTGLRTAVITNGRCIEKIEKMNRVGVLHLFDVIVTSEMVGEDKPSTMPFRYALTRFGINSGEAVHIGDAICEDVVGASRAGIHPILVGSSKEISKIATQITELVQLMNVIGTVFS